MKHYILSVGNVQGFGGTDPKSIEEFLLTVKDDSMAHFAAQNLAIDEIQKKKVPGLSTEINSKIKPTEIPSFDELGAAWISTGQLEITPMN
jgi:hypothetical protein